MKHTTSIEEATNWYISQPVDTTSIEKQFNWYISLPIETKKEYISKYCASSVIYETVNYADIAIMYKATHPVDYVGLRFKFKGETIIYTIYENNMDFIFIYSIGDTNVKSFWSIYSFEASINNGRVVIVSNNSVLDTEDDTSNDGSSPKKYVGVRFTNPSDKVVRIIDSVSDSKIFCFFEVDDYRERRKYDISRFEQYIADGTWVIVKDESSDISPIGLEEAAYEHALKVWGVYIDDVNPDFDNRSVGEISQKDFISGAEWQRDNAKSYTQEEMQELLNMLGSVTSAYICSIPPVNRQPHQKELIERSNALINRFKTK